jgi:hypothetical protein
MLFALPNAGIAQLVERNLAKVEVASSRLVSRSSFLVGGRLLSLCGRGYGFPSYLPMGGGSVTNHPAGWQSGHAAACKAVYAGSIPTPASIGHTSRSVPEAGAYWSRRVSMASRRHCRLVGEAFRGQARTADD